MVSSGVGYLWKQLSFVVDPATIIEVFSFTALLFAAAAALAASFGKARIVLQVSSLFLYVTQSRFNFS